jgi:hypothetical protein
VCFVDWLARTTPSTNAHSGVRHGQIDKTVNECMYCPNHAYTVRKNAPSPFINVGNPCGAKLAQAQARANRTGDARWPVRSWTMCIVSTDADVELRKCLKHPLQGPAPPPTHTQRAYEALKDATHALTRRSPNPLRVLHHDDIIEVVRRMLRRGGVPSTKEPRLTVLHIQGPSSARPPAGARGDLPFSLEGDQWIGDVSIIDDIHPGVATYRAAAAQTDGGAAAHRDADKIFSSRRPNTGGMDRAATTSCP